MKNLTITVGSALLLTNSIGLAGPLTVPNSFSSGTVISSSQMNANFDAVKAAVNDNDTRLSALEGASGSGSTCPADMKQVGTWCVDTYEASAWDAASGGTQMAPADITTAGCTANGEGCSGVFAQSVAGVPPLDNVSWLQAAQLCANSGKQLLPNAVWQVAAAGTNDPDANDGTGNALCNTQAPSNAVRNTGLAGSLADQANSCVSNHGVEDMIGNVGEWVADWLMAVAEENVIGGLTTGVIRGGDRNDGAVAGLDRLDGIRPLTLQTGGTGFRCGRPL